MRLIPKNPTMKAVSLLTLILGVEPLFIYYCARLLFHLPSEQQWDKNGGNGGPWGNEPLPAIFTGIPLVLLAILPIATLAASIAIAVKEKRTELVAQGTVICAAQWALAFLQFVTISWTIE